jgi:signal peptidase I
MQKLLALLRNKYFKFSFAVTIYILWVIWLKDYWFFLGIPIVFDIYVSKKINWSPWKKRNKKNSAIIEWIDAIIFAVIAVTIINIFLFQNYKIPSGSMEKTLLIGDHLYVSKVSYGPRIPNTPLSFPFAQNILWDDVPSFLTWIQWPYKRIAGFGSIKNDDIVVFNFPEGDTVALEKSDQSYYGIIYEKANYIKEQNERIGIKYSDSASYNDARASIWKENTIVYRPVDKTDNYVKRCVAIAGDTLKVVKGKVYINGKPQKDIPGIQYSYNIMTNGTPMNSKTLQDMGISEKDIYYDEQAIILMLNKENLDKLKTFRNVIGIQPRFLEPGQYDFRTFPHSSHFQWNQDFYGPLYIPKKGATIKINTYNIPLYQRIIGHYEHNTLEIKDTTIFINGKPATEYTFQMNYYFMMGDNRHNSLDSRFWGFVPDDHVVGKPIFIWLSLDSNKSFLGKIRWNRMFTKVRT